MGNFKHIWQASNGTRELEELRLSSVIRKKHLAADFSPVFSQTIIYESSKYEAQETDPGAWSSGVIGSGSVIGSKFGVSAPTLSKFLGHPCTVDEMMSLTEDQAEAIAKKFYWDVIKGDSINNQGIAAAIFDGLWASGGYSSKMVRQALNQTYGKTVADGNSKAMVLSDNEIALINNVPNPEDLFNNFMLLRKQFIQSIPGYATYGKGWLNRLDDIYNKYFGTFATKTKAFVKQNIVPILIITFGVLVTISVLAAMSAKDKPTLQPVPAT